MNATLTGLGGDCFIIDDPLKPVDAQSDAHRNGLNDWFSNTLMLPARQQGDRHHHCGHATGASQRS